ncbi:hypothetical protein MRX96_020115 [Rhipicephalus microplus]
MCTKVLARRRRTACHHHDYSFASAAGVRQLWYRGGSCRSARGLEAACPSLNTSVLDCFSGRPRALETLRRLVDIWKRNTIIAVDSGDAARGSLCSLVT